jgi:predicted RND superfamily exporter protein
VANTIFLPLIVGAGVEYGIIILYRWQEGRMQPGHLPLSTGKGVILATLTTTIGFGSLMLCRYRGTFSLGVLAFVGSLFVLAATLVLMPASMAFLTPPQLSLEKEERTI